MVSDNKYIEDRHTAEDAASGDGCVDRHEVEDAVVQPAALSILLVAALLGTVACGLAFLNLASLI
jgi:hypothetical protein